MADLDPDEQATADSMAARFVSEQGIDPARAAVMAKGLVLQASSAGVLMSLEGEDK